MIREAAQHVLSPLQCSLRWEKRVFAIFSCPACVGPRECSCLDTAFLPSLQLEGTSQRGEEHCGPQVVQQKEDLVSLTLTKEVREIGLHHSLVEGLGLAVDVMKGLVVVVLNSVLHIHNLQAT